MNMEVRPAKRLEQFPEYVHARLAKAVAEVERASGRKVLSLGIGSPDVPPSPRYLDKLSEFVRASICVDVNTIDEYL